MLLPCLVSIFTLSTTHIPEISTMQMELELVKLQRDIPDEEKKVQDSQFD